MTIDRNFLGRLVRRVWVQWAYTQPNAKSSWTMPFDDLPPEQQEVDCLIGEKVAEVATEKLSAEVKKLKRMAEIKESASHKFCPDCRDKVQDENCLRCQVQWWKAEYTKLSKMRDRLLSQQHICGK